MCVFVSVCVCVCGCVWVGGCVGCKSMSMCGCACLGVVVYLGVGGCLWVGGCLHSGVGACLNKTFMQCHGSGNLL